MELHKNSRKQKKNHLEKKQINLAKAKELKLMDSKECCGLDE
jgi:hypothetical protein